MVLSTRAGGGGEPRVRPLVRIVSPAWPVGCRGLVFFPSAPTLNVHGKRICQYVLGWLPLTPLVLFISSVHHVRDCFFWSLIARRLFLEFGTNHKITPVLRIARAALSETTGIVVEFCNALVRLTSRFEFENKVGEPSRSSVCAAVSSCAPGQRRPLPPGVSQKSPWPPAVSRFIQQLRPEFHLHLIFFSFPQCTSA